MVKKQKKNIISNENNYIFCSDSNLENNQIAENIWHRENREKCNSIIIRENNLKKIKKSFSFVQIKEALKLY